jgi:hypothetical protein
MGGKLRKHCLECKTVLTVTPAQLLKARGSILSMILDVSNDSGYNPRYPFASVMPSWIHGESVTSNASGHREPTQETS